MKVDIKLRSISKAFAIARQTIEVAVSKSMPQLFAQNSILHAMIQTPESVFQPVNGRPDKRRHKRYSRRQVKFSGPFTVIPTLAEGGTLDVGIEFPSGSGVYIVEGGE